MLSTLLLIESRLFDLTQRLATPDCLEWARAIAEVNKVVELLFLTRQGHEAHRGFHLHHLI